MQSKHLPHYTITPALQGFLKPQCMLKNFDSLDVAMTKAMGLSVALHLGDLDWEGCIFHNSENIWRGWTTAWNKGCQRWGATTLVSAPSKLPPTLPTNSNVVVIGCY